jgi:hypothetical protein
LIQSFNAAVVKRSCFKETEGISTITRAVTALAVAAAITTTATAIVKVLSIRASSFDRLSFCLHGLSGFEDV